MLILLPEGGSHRLFVDGGGDPTQLVFRLLAIQVHTARASFMWGSKKKCAGVKSDIRSVSLRHYMVSAANQSPTTATF